MSMNWVGSLYTNHPYISTIGTMYVVSAFVGALPSPTKDSTPLYQFVFKFCNILGANIVRALSNQLEKSPNWQDAQQKAKDQANAA